MNTHTSTSPASPITSAAAADWWRGAVIYQIYPRSYQDSNGDGIGDIAGITERLPHIASLGVDAIWISPFFTSPMLDFGYDVSNYRDVDPMFGTLADFDAMLAQAHDLGIKVLIDLVLSHTSEQHPWFQESRKSHTNAKADWYVWADAKPDGTAPNNWLSIFGGPAWQWNTEREQYYLHNFLAEQPDLNLHNPQVQDELLDVARFWLDRGVDGFRLDTINFYFHDQELRDNPALPAEERSATIAPSVNPYNWQNHLYDKNRPENLAFLRRLRALTDQYPGITIVGEVGDGQRGMEIQAEYTSGNDKVHMCYDFAFLSAAEPTGSRVGDVLTKFENISTDGWACWAFSNHDVVRHPSRWSLSDAQSRLYLTLLLSLRGSVCLYQGEELGLAEADVAFEDLQDPYGIRFWPEFKGRDGCRTPMPWANDNTHGGFSEAKPWLPVAPAHVQNAVAAQQNDPTSMLSFYKRALAFRKANPALINGTLELLHADDDLITLTRTPTSGVPLFCAFNLTSAPLTTPLPAGTWQAAEKAPYDVPSQGAALTLPAHAAAFFRGTS